MFKLSFIIILILINMIAVYSSEEFCKEIQQNHIEYVASLGPVKYFLIRKDGIGYYYWPFYEYNDNVGHKTNFDKIFNFTNGIGNNYNCNLNLNLNSSLI